MIIRSRFDLKDSDAKDIYSDDFAPKLVWGADLFYLKIYKTKNKTYLSCPVIVQFGIKK